MKSREWLVLIGNHPSVSALDLAFVPPRSRLRSVELENLLEPGSSVGGELRDKLVTVLLPGVHKGFFVGLLRVTYEEDAPLIAEGVWESDDAEDPKGGFRYAIPIDLFAQGGLVGPSASGIKELPVSLIRYLWQGLLAPHAIPLGLIRPEDRGRFFERHLAAGENIFALRRTAMDCDNRTRQFFLGLDAGTLASEVPEVWRNIAAGVNSRLAVRVDVRAMLGRDRQVPVFARSARFATSLQQASMFVQTLIITHLYDSGSDLVDWAFTRFAVEGLAVTHPRAVEHGLLQSHGAPDGEAFFRFAELALACIDHGIHSDFWQRHLGTLVRTAHVYAEHGGELNASGRRIYSYRENRRFPTNRLRVLGGLYQVPQRQAPLEFLEDRFTSLLAQALDLTGSTPVDTRPLRHEATFEPQDTDRELADRALAFFDETGLFRLLASL